MTSYLAVHARRAATELAPGVHASITIRHHGVVIRAASSSPEASECDLAEIQDEVGPSSVAMETLAPARVHAVARETRWPGWAGRAYDAGFEAAIAIPVMVDQTIRTSLNLYLHPGRTLTYTDEQIARIRAELIASSIATRVHAHTVDADILSEVTVDYAVGLLMYANGLRPQDARVLISFLALRAGTTTQAVAGDLVAMYSNAH